MRGQGGGGVRKGEGWMERGVRGPEKGRIRNKKGNGWGKDEKENKGHE